MKKMMFIFLNGEFWHYCTVEEKFNSKDLALLDLYEKIGGEPEDNKFYIDEDGDFVVEKEDEDGDIYIETSFEQFEVLDAHDLLLSFDESDIEKMLKEIGLDMEDLKSNV